MGASKLKLFAFLAVTSLLITNTVFSKDNSEIEKLKQTVVTTYDGNQITFDELDNAFRKNVNKPDACLWNVSQDSINNFFNLYTNYKLKIKNAIERGFENDSTVIADMQSHHKVLAESFFYEKKITTPHVTKMLERRNREIQIAVIIASAKSETDTIDAFNKANKLMKMLKSGADFASIAKDSSDDKEYAKNGGVVPQFLTSARAQRQLEDAIYETKNGDIFPEPIRTRVGYVIVKVIKNEPRYKVRASHILITKDAQKDSLTVYKKADSILAAVKSGVDFGTLAMENSDDKVSAQRNGDLGDWYSRSTGFEKNGRNLFPEFENALFALNDAEISGLVKSDYGIHIIRHDATKKIDLKAEEDDIRKSYKRLYFETDKRIFLDSIKKSLGFEIVENTFMKFLGALDSTKTNLDSVWAKNIPSNIEDDVIFKISNQKTTVNEFVKMLEKRYELRGTSTKREGMIKAINKLTDPVAFELASANLDKEYPDFRALLDDFKNGILLFRVEAIEVWDKLKFDTTLAREYYDTTKQKYFTIPYYSFTEIFLLSDSTAKDIYKQATNGANFENLAEKYTERAGYREKKGKYSKLAPKENALARLVDQKKLKVGEIMEPFKFENGYVVIKLDSYEPPKQKSFEDAIPDFAPAFQELLQKQISDKWVGSLRQKYNAKLDFKALDNTVKQLKSLSK